MLEVNYEKRIKEAQEKLNQARHPQIIMSFEVATSSDEKVCAGCSELEGLKDDVFNAVIGVNHPPPS